MIVDIKRTWRSSLSIEDILAGLDSIRFEDPAYRNLSPNHPRCAALEAAINVFQRLRGQEEKTDAELLIEIYRELIDDKGLRVVIPVSFDAPPSALQRAQEEQKRTLLDIAFRLLEMRKEAK